MSQENVEVIKAVVAAFNRGEWDAALSYAAPGFKFDTSRGLNEWRGEYVQYNDHAEALEAVGLS
jgi:hypothetical protein